MYIYIYIYIYTCIHTRFSLCAVIVLYVYCWLAVIARVCCIMLSLRHDTSPLCIVRAAISQGRPPSYASDASLSLRGTKVVPRKGVRTSVNMRVRTRKGSRAKHGQTIRCLRPPFLETPYKALQTRGSGVRRRAVGTRCARNLQLYVFYVYLSLSLYIYIYIYICTYIYIYI